MSESYDRIKEGLNDALVFARGQKTGAVIHQIKVLSVDVAAIRATTVPSQREFAKNIGAAKGTYSIGNMAADSQRVERKPCSR